MVVASGGPQLGVLSSVPDPYTACMDVNGSNSGSHPTRSQAVINRGAEWQALKLSHLVEGSSLKVVEEGGLQKWLRNCVQS